MNTNYVGIIMAAGKSTRMTDGKYPKQLLALNPSSVTILDRSIAHLNQGGIEKILLITSEPHHSHFVKWHEQLLDSSLVTLIKVGGSIQDQIRQLAERLDQDETAVIVSGDLVFAGKLDLQKITTRIKSLPPNLPFLHLVFGSIKNPLSKRHILPFHVGYWVTNGLTIKNCVNANPESYATVLKEIAKLLYKGKFSFSMGSPFINLNTQTDLQLASKFISVWDNTNLKQE